MSKKKQRITVKLLQGLVNVSHRKSGKRWYSTALEFDIVGTGDSRKKSFAQLQELVSEYVFAIVDELDAGARVQFFNPSDAEEWNRGQREQFEVTFVLEVDQKADVSPTITPQKLGDLAGEIQSIDLVPAGV